MKWPGLRVYIRFLSFAIAGARAELPKPTKAKAT